MATIVKTTAPFKIIKGKASEFLTAGYGAGGGLVEEVIQDGFFKGYTQLTVKGGGYLVCDRCNEEIKRDEQCYYVAVLNAILCEGCFKGWLNFATYYPLDEPYERRHFDCCISQLKSAGVEVK